MNFIATKNLKVTILKFLSLRTYVPNKSFIQIMIPYLKSPFGLMLKAFFFVLIFLTFGCHSKNEKGATYDLDDSMAEPVSPPTTEQVEIQRKLIKEGNLEFQTDDIQATRKILFQAVEKYKGYISSDQEYKTQERISNTVVVRVPSSNFEKLLSDATEGVDKFDHKNIEVKDVTEEFLDVKARLKTKKELEDRYIDLLKKANNIKEILEIENQIGLLRTEIESIEGRMKYLESQISFSTLTLTFYEKRFDGTKFSGKFKDGFTNGWENFVWFFVFLVNIWPFIFLLLGIVVGIRMWKRRSKKI